eukprot:scaffold114222_cov63-Phaeocystis_antarctica.AAC.5
MQPGGLHGRCLLCEELLVLVLQAAVPCDDPACELLAAAASVPVERLCPSGRLPEERHKGAGAAPAPFQAVLLQRNVGVPNEDVAVCRPRKPAAGLLASSKLRQRQVVNIADPLARAKLAKQALIARAAGLWQVCEGDGVGGVGARLESCTALAERRLQGLLAERRQDSPRAVVVHGPARADHLSRTRAAKNLIWTKFAGAVSQGSKVRFSHPPN